MNKVNIVYHKQTGTHWVNDLNWKERHKTESIRLGEVEIDSNDFDVVMDIMNEDDYYLLDDEDNPYLVMTEVTEKIDRGQFRETSITEIRDKLYGGTVN
jgi:hypothetical protein